MMRFTIDCKVRMEGEIKKFSYRARGKGIKGRKPNERFFHDAINELAIEVNKKLPSAVCDLFYFTVLCSQLNLDSLELYATIKELR